MDERTGPVATQHRAMAARDLPPVNELTEQQQRGWRCVWCRHPLTVGDDIDMGEQRATPAGGAAYSWFPRACADTEACTERTEQRTADPLHRGRA
ncbi:hypothetical protein [Streptomyces sp. NPDC057460]|uniref:hypothetical protein n=1 Tax=Streptomyces sp. NPDC057460 TaxID=3346141 RepID=UPI0036ACB791